MGSHKSANPDVDLDNVLDNDNQTAEPPQYKVLLINDDYTPMDFVIFVLRKFFAKNDKDAHTIMLDVHTKGAGIAGIYSFEVAETKVAQVNQFSKDNQYPLKSTLDEV